MRQLLWLAIGALFLASPAAAQSRLFSDEAPLNLILESNFPQLVRNAKTKPDPYPATLIVQDGAAAQKLALEINARGKSRRTGELCAFPPLSLAFGDKQALRGTLFQGQGKLKLVTYCRADPSQEQRIILEYTAYRLFNAVTPLSHRVRAARVTYRTAEGARGAVTRFGFLIEDVDDLAKRNDRDEFEAKTGQFRPDQLDAHAVARAAVFEYMIGNLDWAFTAGVEGDDCCHNANLIAAVKATPATARGIVPVPYDFDYSGLVDAPYAGTPAGVSVERVTDRLYRGYCFANPELPAAVEEFRSKRTQILAVIANEPLLTERTRQKAARFLEGFFITLDNPSRVQSQLAARCR